jgi:hypothetical protein
MQDFGQEEPDVAFLAASGSFLKHSGITGERVGNYTARW